jgi:hypothetical protein
MAIGTSPCPPFANRCGLPPGVIWDGNTVAWYKYNDPVAGVIKDGANRVAFWLDKYNYSVGAEMIDQAHWFEAGYWNFFNGNWTQVGNTLHSDGNNGNTQKLGFWVIGSTYKITITITLIAGTLTPSFDGVIPPNVLNATGTYTYYYTPAVATMQLTSNLFNGNVTALSIKQVTGKHLLQATVANQPLWSVANGVLFDGINDNLKATAFAFIQPCFFYIVLRQITWTINKRLLSGNVAADFTLYQNIATPQINLYAGAGFGNTNLILNTFSILRSSLNGINSSIQINKTVISNGDASINNPDGFNIGSDSAPGGWSNVEFKEIILRKITDNAATQDAIYNYLKTANGV